MNALKKVVLVARDSAPSKSFRSLGRALEERGLDVRLIVGDGNTLTETDEAIAFAAQHANVVILGMSSPFESRQEIIAGNAARAAGVLYGFLGDIKRCWARARKGAWFEELAPDAGFYFGVTQEDADAAREVFPNAQLIGTGNPLLEGMAFPNLTRNEVRTKLGMAPEEKLVLASGDKFAYGSMALWTITMEALRLLTSEDCRFRLVLTTHPGDRTPYAIDAESQAMMNLYGELVSLSPVPTQIVGKEILTTSDIIPGADLIVQFASLVGIEGAYQGIPVVTLGFETLLHRFEQTTGNRKLETVESGASELVIADVDVLAETIRRLLTPEGFAPMRTQQQKAYPRPKERGAAVRVIADAIARMI